MYTHSIWALATPEELEISLAVWKNKIEDGILHSISLMILRLLGEQATSIVAYKGL